MAGGSQALIERSKLGVLARPRGVQRLQGASDVAAKVRCAVTVAGRADKMTPKRSTGSLESMPDARTVVIDGAGHMMMHEDPKAVRGMLAELL